MVPVLPENMKDPKERSDEGFSLIELIIVVAMLAVLLVITIVFLTGARHDAMAASIQSDFSHNAKYLEVYKIENGHYPKANGFSTIAVISKENYDYRNNNFLYCSDEENYVIFAVDTDNRRYVQSSMHGFSRDINIEASHAAVCPALGVPEPYDRRWFKSEGNWLL